MNTDPGPPSDLDACSPAARTLCIGGLSRDEESSIARIAPASRLWQRAENLLQAQRILGQQSIDRVLLAQARPGQLPPDTPQRIAAWAPDAEVLCLAGDWCEGELRTGQAWQDVPRRYWWEAVAEEPAAQPSMPPLVLACVATPDAGAMWADVLESLGYACVAVRRGRPEPTVVGEQLAIWDGDQLDGREADQLADFCARRRRRGANVIAVFDYPRGDVVRSALDLGAAAVLGRPWTLGALENGIAAALSRDADVDQPTAPWLRVAA